MASDRDYIVRRSFLQNISGENQQISLAWQDEAYTDEIRGRIQAIKPGFYTRMGAAIRQATKVLNEQRTSQKLMLILTDGKPNDIDHYEGRLVLKILIKRL